MNTTNRKQFGIFVTEHIRSRDLSRILQSLQFLPAFLYFTFGYSLPLLIQPFPVNVVCRSLDLSFFFPITYVSVCLIKSLIKLILLHSSPRCNPHNPPLKHCLLINPVGQISKKSVSLWSTCSFVLVLKFLDHVLSTSTFVYK